MPDAAGELSGEDLTPSNDSQLKDTLPIIENETADNPPENVEAPAPESPSTGDEPEKSAGEDEIKIRVKKTDDRGNSWAAWCNMQIDSVLSQLPTICGCNRILGDINRTEVIRFIGTAIKNIEKYTAPGAPGSGSLKREVFKGVVTPLRDIQIFIRDSELPVSMDEIRIEGDVESE